MVFAIYLIVIVRICCLNDTESPPPDAAEENPDGCQVAARKKQSRAGAPNHSIPMVKTITPSVHNPKRFGEKKC
jgi:hypothetical protein